MYIPKHYQGTNHKEAVSFMREFNFAPLISCSDQKIVATHLPFVINDDNNLTISSHLSIANQQWKAFEGQECMVIFNEPHAYISPQHYEKEQNVPTWNYLAVHAYGRPQIIPETEEKIALLEAMIQSFESSYLEQWRSLSEEYKMRMLKGIVAFNMVVEDLQFKKKLSQNKTENEQRSIFEYLKASERTAESDLSRFMKQDEDHP